MALLWTCARPYVLITGVLLLITGVGAGLRVLLAKWMIDRLIDPATRTFGDLLPLLAGLGLLIVLIEFAIGIRPHVMRLIEGALTRHTQEKIFDVSANVRYGWFDRPGFYQLLERAQQGTQTKTQAVVQGVEALLDGLVGLISLLAVLIVIDPLLAVIVVIAYIPALITSLRSGKGYYELQQSLTEGDRRRKYLTTLLADRAAAKEIRVNGSGGHLRGLLRGLWDERITELSRLVRTRILAAFLAAFSAGSITFAAALLIVFGVVSGRLTVASAAAAVLVLWEAGTNLQVLSWSAGQLREVGLFVSDYEAFLRFDPDAPARGEPAGPASLRVETVEMRGVYFRYPGATRDTLHGVDLRLTRGSVVALVGLSGAGKTTLVKLLCGFYPPSSGQILWDSRDFSAEGSEALRDRIAVIFQDYVQYAFSARHNIELGAPDRPTPAMTVREAAAAAGADGFLHALPDGYDTMLSKEYSNGVDLSGGQWQRVALARALYRDSPLLILDEPTSALDPLSEREVIDTIRRRCRDKAVLLISHRLSAVSMCDRAYVMEHGRVVESGRHDDLIAGGGVYADLYRTNGRRPG
ncbi:ABC transporter ATP-binding protein [Rhizohabitans arisaemae]|uniref:ABC transporter ATP-binding protein n=1 Tax=Rhizohabitans arisaemae TaxID=2720610 RepID=UPI0024B164ED|nr:ABC transporter ATP-binding protein [Rhizohabitans arisaemae]